MNDFCVPGSDEQHVFMSEELQGVLPAVQDHVKNVASSYVNVVLFCDVNGKDEAFVGIFKGMIIDDSSTEIETTFELEQALFAAQCVGARTKEHIRVQVLEINNNVYGTNLELHGIRICDVDHDRGMCTVTFALK